jgi:hypothetical protein
MWAFREAERSESGRDVLTFVLGAAGGLALGLLVSRAAEPVARARSGSGLRQRARAVVDRYGPARLRREPREQADLMELEDAVIDAMLEDEVLRERGIDVGALSVGVIELSGAVATDDEADRAVRVANTVPGVRTVLNRLDVEARARAGAGRAAQDDDDDGAAATEWGWSGLNSGMGRRRQGRSTDPDRPDDSQHIRQKDLDYTDRAQWMEEGLAAKNPRTSASADDLREPTRPGFDDDEMDNQDPHGQHTATTDDAPPQRFNTDSRVGEGLKPGTELALEAADLPVKPHAAPGSGGGADRERKDKG